MKILCHDSAPDMKLFKRKMKDLERQRESTIDSHIRFTSKSNEEATEIVKIEADIELNELMDEAEDVLWILAEDKLEELESLISAPEDTEEAYSDIDRVETLSDSLMEATNKIKDAEEFRPDKEAEERALPMAGEFNLNGGENPIQ